MNKGFSDPHDFYVDMVPKFDYELMDPDVIGRGFDQQVKALGGGHLKGHPGGNSEGLAVLGVRRLPQGPAVHGNDFRIQAGDLEYIQ